MNFDKYYFKEDVDSSPREGIKHLYNSNKRYSLSQEDFLDIVNYLNANDSRLDSVNSSITEKADGFSLKFGLDADDRFFIESSNSDPIYDEGEFNKFTLDKKGQTDPISEGYEDILVTLKNNEKLQEFLRDINTYSGIKIITECFYMPLADVDEDSDSVKFIATWYKKKLVGSWATFVVLDVLDGRTNSLDNSEDIKKQLMSLSDNKIKFVDNKVNIEPIDFSKELETVKNFINKIEQEYGTNIKEILNSKVDNKKLLIKNTINNFQKQFSNKLKSLVNSGNFGDYEGLVISLYNGLIFKVISDNFTRNKKEKRNEIQ